MRAPKYHAGDLVAASLFAILAALVAVTFGDYGVTFDEDVQDQYGRFILSWYASGGADRAAVEFLDLFYYGGLFDTLAALANLVSPFGHFETRHLLNGIAGLVGLAGAWRLARRLGGPLAGAAAVLLLAAMPSWYGMMFNNPKDIPFAAAMVWSIHYLTLIAESPGRVPWRVVTRFGLAAGCCLGVRIGGLLVIAYLGAVLCLPALELRRQPRAAAAAVAGGLVRVLLPGVALAWAVMLLVWPYAQLAPLAHPIDAYRHFSGFEPGIETLFMGEEVNEIHRPLAYLPVYLGIKLPMLVLVVLAAALGLGLSGLRRHGLPRRLVPLALGLGFPIAFVLVTRPELYDAERHFLFLLPLLAVTCGLAVAALAERLSRAAGVVAMTAGLAALVPHIGKLVELHPYEYTFYNGLTGGLAGARDRFEADYWGASLTEAARRLGELAPGERASVAVCGNTAAVEAVLPKGLVVEHDWQKADFFIATTRHHCERDLAGTELLRVEREGVPFAVVKELHPVHARRPTSTALRRS